MGTTSKGALLPVNELETIWVTGGFLHSVASVSVFPPSFSSTCSTPPTLLVFSPQVFPVGFQSLAREGTPKRYPDYVQTH